MLALSLTEPWAVFAVIPVKHVETRSWATRHRGVIAIHAAKGFPADAQAHCGKRYFREALVNAGYKQSAVNYKWRLPLGEIVGVARLVDCISVEQLPFSIWRDLLTPQEIAFGDYNSGRYGLILLHARRLAEPIPCRGALGFWQVPADVEAKIRAQVDVERLAVEGLVI